jgi:hypothetical protein
VASAYERWNVDISRAVKKKLNEQIRERSVEKKQSGLDEMHAVSCQRIELQGTNVGHSAALFTTIHVHRSPPSYYVCLRVRSLVIER